MRKETAFLLLLVLLSGSVVAQQSNDASSGLVPGLIELDDFIQVEVNSADNEVTGNQSSAGAADTGEGDTGAAWIIFMALFLTGVVIYSFDFDPFHVAIILLISGLIVLQLGTGFLPI